MEKCWSKHGVVRRSGAAAVSGIVVVVPSLHRRRRVTPDEHFIAITVHVRRIHAIVLLLLLFLNCRFCLIFVFIITDAADELYTGFEEIWQASRRISTLLSLLRPSLLESGSSELLPCMELEELHLGDEPPTKCWLLHFKPWLDTPNWSFSFSPSLSTPNSDLVAPAALHANAFGVVVAAASPSCVGSTLPSHGTTRLKVTSLILSQWFWLVFISKKNRILCLKILISTIFGKKKNLKSLNSNFWLNF